jgi:catechol 2,3-dioxygenase-like lactoylglutathione lyase family enzyme
MIDHTGVAATNYDRSKQFYVRALVDEFYKAALAAGGRDNGRPGLRPHYHEKYYGAFVLDPDGNNIEACCHT